MVIQLNLPTDMDAEFGQLYAGLATVGYTLRNPDATVYRARTQVGVTDIGAGGYRVTLTLAATWKGYIDWDTGGASPKHAIEHIETAGVVAVPIGTGANIVTLEDYTPSPRFDNIPWFYARIDEAAAHDGPYNVLGTVTLNPLDTDPKNPQTRDFTFSTDLVGGWYRIVFQDSYGKQQLPTDPVQNIQTDISSLLPSVEEVGALLRARTKDSLGNEVGTFTIDTRPTYAQVFDLIQQAAEDVTAVTDTDIPEQAKGNVRKLVALGAAIYVEMSYFPEQVSAGHSPVDRFQKMYDAALPRVENAIMREAVEVIEGEQVETDVNWYFDPPPIDWGRVKT